MVDLFFTPFNQHSHNTTTYTNTAATTTTIQVSVLKNFAGEVVNQLMTHRGAGTSMAKIFLGQIVTKLSTLQVLFVCSLFSISISVVCLQLLLGS